MTHRLLTCSGTSERFSFNCYRSDSGNQDCCDNRIAETTHGPVRRRQSEECLSDTAFVVYSSRVSSYNKSFL